MSPPRVAASDPERLSRLKIPLAAVSLCALVALAYSNTFHSGFIVDSQVLLQDPRVRGFSFDNLALILRHSYWWPNFESGLYRPVTTLSYFLNYTILGNGENPTGYHWLNLLLHFANVLLLWAIARRLMSFWPATFTSAVWAVHPVLTESITNIAGRADLLAALAVLGGFWMLLKSTCASTRARIFWLTGLTLVTTIGLFSKENAVAILGVIAFYGLINWRDREKLHASLLGCAAIIPSVLLMRWQRASVFARSDPPINRFVENPLLGANFLVARLTALKVLAKYVWLLVWPAKLSWDYSYNQIPLVRGAVADWAAAITLVLLLAVAAVLLFKDRVAFFFFGFAFIAIVPVSNLIIKIGAIMAERFLYLPSAGFAGCIVIGAFALARGLQSPKLAPIILSVLLAAYGARTLARNADWKDPMSLDTSGVRTSPDSFKTHHALASDLFESDRALSNLDSVLAESDKSVAILDPIPDALNSAETFTNAGTYYEREGTRLARAGASGAAQKSLDAYHRSLKLLERARRIDEAQSREYRAEQIARGKPDSQIAPHGLPQLYLELALTYARLGDLPNALEAELHASQLAPERTDYLVMSSVLQSMRRNHDATVALLKGLLVGEDNNSLARLRILYSSGLDPNHCAFTQSTGSWNLNEGCEAVHVDLCQAAAELSAAFHTAQKPDLASKIDHQAINEFRCTQLKQP